YQTDLVDGLLAMMACPRDPGPINLGNPEEMTIRAIAELIVELTGSRSTFEHRPLPSNDPTRRRPDITKARRILGWEPRVSVRDGLLETIDYYRARMPARRGNGQRKLGDRPRVVASAKSSA